MRMCTQIYTKRVQSAKSLELLSIRAEFISTSKRDGDGQAFILTTCCHSTLQLIKCVQVGGQTRQNKMRSRRDISSSVGELRTAKDETSVNKPCCQHVLMFAPNCFFFSLFHCCTPCYITLLCDWVLTHQIEVFSLSLECSPGKKRLAAPFSNKTYKNIYEIFLFTQPCQHPKENRTAE